MKLFNRILLLSFFIPLFNSNSYAQDSLNVSKLGELYYCWDGAQDIVVVDHYAYVADYLVGIHIMDVSDPADPVELTLLQLPSECDVIEAGDGFLYAACQDNLIRIYDLSDPIQPLFVSGYNLDAPALDLHLSGSLLHLVNDDDDYLILDVSDPLNPLSLGGLTIPGFLEGIEVTGNYTYISGQVISAVLDISDPAHPTIETYPPVFGYDVKIADNFAYFAGFSFAALNITDPANPFLVGSIQTGDENYCVQVIGPYAYAGVFDS